MRLLSAFTLVATTSFAQPLVAPNASVWVTDAMKAAASLEASTKASPRHLLTTAETSNWQKTGRYDEAVELYKSLAKASPQGKLIDIGETPMGRRMYVFVASKDKAFTPEAARRTGKPILLLQQGIHPGENGGKDAAIMLLRDILVSKRYASLLDHVIILAVPVFNVDGHENSSPYHRINEQGPVEMGFRATSQRLNLNRDYMKADAPEMRNWLKMFNAWNPDLLIDNHVTDGSDLQYDITIDLHDGADLHPAVAKWSHEKWLPSVWGGMEKQGHVMGWYIGGPPRTPFVITPMSPRYSTGYASVRNRPAMLIETHSLKPFKVRAWAHYDVMLETLNALAKSGAELRQATAQADREHLTPGSKLGVTWAGGKEGEAYVIKALETETYTGAVTGAPVNRYLAKPRNLNVTLVRDIVPRVTATVPKGYWIPRSWPALAHLLEVHGVKLEIAKSASTIDAEMARFSKVGFPPQPFESRFQPMFETTWSKAKVEIAPGDWFVSTAQPLGRLVVNLLDPDAPDSMVKWGLVNSIFEMKEYAADYIFEPLAAKLFAENPSLKAEFEAALAADKTMAGNRRARMEWVYQRTPFYEADKDLYPVCRLP